MGDRFMGKAAGAHVVAPCSTPALHERGRCACAGIFHTDTAAGETAAAVSLGVVTARMLIEQASADWERWQEGSWIGGTLRGEDPRTPLEVLDAGVIDQAEFWAIVNRCQPCACWSCDQQCGSSVLDCGLVERDELGRWVCAACREMTDVIDNEHNGVRAALSADEVAIRLDADVWGFPHGSRLWLAPATARRLAARLVELAELADNAAETDRLLALHRSALEASEQ